MGEPNIKICSQFAVPRIHKVCTFIAKPKRVTVDTSGARGRARNGWLMARAWVFQGSTGRVAQSIRCCIPAFTPVSTSVPGVHISQTCPTSRVSAFPKDRPKARLKPSLMYSTGRLTPPPPGSGVRSYGFVRVVSIGSLFFFSKPYTPPHTKGPANPGTTRRGYETPD